MKQLKISYAIYNKRDELLRQGTYLTTCDDKMNPRILKTAMALLTVSSKVKGGYFVILDIEFKPEEERITTLETNEDCQRMKDAFGED